MLNPINPHAAGVDVGSEQLFVAVVNGPVHRFETVSVGLDAAREYLCAQGIRSVALEATGVYWLPLYEVLEAAGLEVCVVNGAHVKSLPGRKSDVADCQWLAELHSLGLLRPGFVPPAAIRELRDYQRVRQDHITMASAHIQHMQKALERMNVKLHDVLTRATGSSSLRIIRAIVGGERDPEQLLELADGQVLAKKRTRLREALRGRWQPQHLFALAQALRAWEFYQAQIAECDRAIATVLRALAATAAADAAAPPAPDARGPRPKRDHNAPHIEHLKRLLVQLTGGQDLAALPALTDYTVLQLLSETGTDMRRWPTEKHFTAWLGVAPSSRQSGKRRRPERRHRGRAGRIFCLVARSLARSKYLALGGFYRRLRATRGPRAAIVACARKLAILYYNALRHGLAYVEYGLQHYERTYHSHQLRRLQTMARRLGATIVAPPSPPLVLAPADSEVPR
jgi:transposase